MKIQNPSDSIILTQDLQDELDWYRTYRSFDPASYLKIKSYVINQYFKKFSIKAVVVGISGGIDSAVVIGILDYIIKNTDTTLEKIIAVVAPYQSIKAGASNQDLSYSKALELCEQFDISPTIVDLSTSLEEIIKITGDSNPWLRGQLVTNLRTPLFYYLASQSTDSGQLAVVSGTTNLDEGAYIGYFAKVGDAMVDIQPISDLHKSEVNKLATYLDIPKSIIDAKPTGDVFDGRTDEEMIGTNYDFVELYFHYLTREKHFNEYFYRNLNSMAKVQFEKLTSRIENIHSYNSHKYGVKSPAKHFDILPTNVDNGWKNQKELNLNTFFPKSSTAISDAKFTRYSTLKYTLPVITEPGVYDEYLSKSECTNLIKHFESLSLERVGIHGGFNNEMDIDGSLRSKSYDIELSKYLFEKYLSLGIMNFKFINEIEAKVRNIRSGYYRPVAINPYFRFLSYQSGNYLVPHYDSETSFGPDFVTLESVLIYLNSCPYGGATQFVTDPQSELEIDQYNFEDWQELAPQDQVLRSVSPLAGRVLVFDHRVLHQGQKLTRKNTLKKLLRTDLIYQIVE